MKCSIIVLSTPVHILMAFNPIFYVTKNYNQKYNRAPGGRIENIVFRNISFSGNEDNLSPSRIMGYDKFSDVRNVLLENISVNGKLWQDTNMLHLNEHVSDLKIKY